MPDVRDIFYHSVHSQVRRVLEAMGEERIIKGVEAFETGASSWSECFFAMAFAGEVSLDHVGNPETEVAQRLGFGDNKVPMRIVYTLFDGIGQSGLTMTKRELLELMRGFLDEKRSPEMQSAIDQLITNTDLSGVESPVWVNV